MCAGLALRWYWHYIYETYKLLKCRSSAFQLTLSVLVSRLVLKIFRFNKYEEVSWQLHTKKMMASKENENVIFSKIHVTISGNIQFILDHVSWWHRFKNWNFPHNIFIISSHQFPQNSHVASTALSQSHWQPMDPRPRRPVLIRQFRLVVIRATLPKPIYPQTASGDILVLASARVCFLKDLVKALTHNFLNLIWNFDHQIICSETIYWSLYLQMLKGFEL